MRTVDKERRRGQHRQGKEAQAGKGGTGRERRHGQGKEAQAGKGGTGRERSKGRERRHRLGREAREMKGGTGKEGRAHRWMNYVHHIYAWERTVYFTPVVEGFGGRKLPIR